MAAVLTWCRCQLLSRSKALRRHRTLAADAAEEHAAHSARTHRCHDDAALSPHQSACQLSQACAGHYICAMCIAHGTSKQAATPARGSKNSATRSCTAGCWVAAHAPSGHGPVMELEPWSPAMSYLLRTTRHRCRMSPLLPLRARPHPAGSGRATGAGTSFGLRIAAQPGTARALLRTRHPPREPCLNAGRWATSARFPAAARPARHSHPATSPSCMPHVRGVPAACAIAITPTLKCAPHIFAVHVCKIVLHLQM